VKPRGVPALRRRSATRFRASLTIGLLVTSGAFSACRDDRHARADSELAAQLSALGYVDWAPLESAGPRGGGVTQYDPAQAQPGLNLFSSRAVPGARLIDLRGSTVHEWYPAAHDAAGWNHVERAPNGDLLVITQTPSLLRLDAASNVLWERPLHVHHDLAVDARGEIFVLERAVVPLERQGRRVRLLGENVVHLDATGEVLARVALHEVLASFVTTDRLKAAAAATPDPRSPWRRARDLWRAPPIDLFHANSIEILPRPVLGLGPAGAALISLRNLDLVVVVDLAARALLWSLGPGVVERQHHASLTANDRLMLFDNGRERRYSRVVEIDPIRRAIVWEYSGTPARSLRSATQGGAEALSNGNVLVVESERGRAIEVTRDGRVAWEFWHPSFDTARDARASIYRMTRAPAP
jgi:hypothetical protein